MLIVEKQGRQFGLHSSHRRLHMGGDYLREIGTAHRPFGTIDGIGSDKHLRSAPLREVTTVVQGDDQHHIGIHRLDVFERRAIGRFLSVEDEIVAGLDAVHELAREGGAVVVDHIHTDVFHLLVHHPRHDTNHHDGEDDDETRQKRIAPNLQKLLLYEIS